MWVLAANVAILPCEELPRELGIEVTHEPGDCAIVELDSGTDAIVVGEIVADLVREFRVPATGPEAASRAGRADLADEATGLAEELAAAGLLVAEDADEQRARGLAGCAARVLDTTIAALETGEGPGDAAGIAYALHRIAAIRDDDALDHAARMWLARGDSPAGPLFAGAATAAYAAALVGDDKDRALVDFIAAASSDVATLVACSRALDAMPGSVMLANVLAHGDEVATRLVTQLAAPADTVSFGIAHGRGGMLHAILSWCDAARAPVPAIAITRLHELASCGESVGHGLRWEWRATSRGRRLVRSTPGWCNGSAGLVHVWILAHRLTGEAAFARLAEATAWNAWQERWTTGTLCCGLAGQAYAVLAHANHTRSPVWLDRAHVLADLAAARIARASDSASQFHRLDRIEPNSLYRGAVGVALLAAELDDPARARMPLFA
jgi:serine/threonine-protein kinase